MADPAMIAVRCAVYAALAAIFGLALFTRHALRDEARRAGSAMPFMRAIAVAASVALLLSALWLVLLVAAMSGVSPGMVDRETIATIVSATAIGAAWQIRLAALLAVLALALVHRRIPRLASGGIVAAGGVALGTLAWTGHGAMDEGARGWVHLIADIAHLLAAGAWIGALIAFLTLAYRKSTDTLLLHRVLHAFAVTGTAVVVVLIVTGAISGWVLVGPANSGALATTDYGRLLLLKLALFALMIVLASANRYLLTPALAAAPHDRAALLALRRSLLVETLAALAILMLVSWLGLLAPPASA